MKQWALSVAMVAAAVVSVTGCGESAEAAAEVIGYLSGDGPGRYDEVRFLVFTDSDGRLTATLTAAANSARSYRLAPVGVVQAVRQ